MKSVTELWVYRVFFGTWLGCVALPYAVNCFRSEKMLDLPLSVVALTIGLAGGDAVGILLRQKVVEIVPGSSPSGSTPG